MPSRPHSTTERLSIDPFTNLPSINTFGDLSNFLRGAVADEDSRVLSESMAELSVHLEAQRIRQAVPHATPIRRGTMLHTGLTK